MLFVFLPDSQAPRLWEVLHLAQPSCAKILDHLIYFFFFMKVLLGQHSIG